VLIDFNSVANVAYYTRFLKFGKLKMLFTYYPDSVAPYNIFSIVSGSTTS